MATAEQYLWQAALNRATGLAREATVVPVGSALLYGQLVVASSSPIEGDDESRLLKWPDLVVHGPLHVRPAVVPNARGKGAGANDGGGKRAVEIRLRLANWKLLAFGPTLSHRITQRNVVDGDKTSSNQSAG
jgi:hypothetical protein